MIVRKTFEEATAKIREWLNYGAVETDKLHAELRAWADYWAPRPKNPCDVED